MNELIDVEITRSCITKVTFTRRNTCKTYPLTLSSSDRLDNIINFGMVLSFIEILTAPNMLSVMYEKI